MMGIKWQFHSFLYLSISTTFLTKMPRQRQKRAKDLVNERPLLSVSEVFRDMFKSVPNGGNINHGGAVLGQDKEISVKSEVLDTQPYTLNDPPVQLVPLISDDSNVPPPVKRKRNVRTTICSRCVVKHVRCDLQKPVCGPCQKSNCHKECKYLGRTGGMFVNKTFNDMVNQESLEKIASLEEKVRRLKEINTYSKRVRQAENHSKARSKPLDKDQKVHEQKPELGRYTALGSNPVFLEPITYIKSRMDDQDLSLIHFEICKQTNGSDITNGTAAFVGFLPPIKDVDTLLHHFFKVCRPIVSFFDRDQTLSQMHRLLEGKGKFSTIDAAQTGQSSLIAILLIMLRFAYISTSWDRPFRATNTIISERYVDYAVDLLMSPHSFGKFTLDKVKGLMLLHKYKMCSPEYDQMSYSTSGIISLLVHSARVLGLNKDILKDPGTLDVTKEIELRKNLWGDICYLDTSYAFDKGMAPSTHLSEANAPLQEATATNKAGQGAGTNHLLGLCANHLSIFLNGQIGQRILNRRELLILSNDLADTSSQFQSFEQLTAQGQEHQDNMSERAKEFVLKLDLTHKEFTVYFLLYAVADRSEKTAYLSKAFEQGLIILRTLHKSVDEKEVFFTPALDRLMLPRLCIAAKLLSLIVLILTKVVLAGEFSLLRSLDYFENPESPAIDWVNFNCTDEKETLSNIIRRVHEIYTASSRLSSKMFSCFEACSLFKLSLEYIASKYPQVAGHIQSDLGWENSIPFQQVLQRWNAREAGV